MAKIADHNYHEELYCVIDQILSVHLKLLKEDRGCGLDGGNSKRGWT